MEEEIPKDVIKFMEVGRDVKAGCWSYLLIPNTAPMLPTPDVKKIASQPTFHLPNHSISFKILRIIGQRLFIRPLISESSGVVLPHFSPCPPPQELETYSFSLNGSYSEKTSGAGVLKSPKYCWTHEVNSR